MTIPTIPPKLHRFLMSLDAATLPVTVEGNESMAMVRLTQAGMLEAVIPEWEELTGTYSGPAWIIRLTPKGIDAALKPPAQ